MSEIMIERETIINFNDAEPDALIWSASPIFWRRIEKLGVSAYDSNSHSRSYRIPKGWVKIRKPALVSEETRQKRSEQARIRFGKDRSSEQTDLLVETEEK